MSKVNLNENSSECHAVKDADNPSAINFEFECAKEVKKNSSAEKLFFVLILI